MSGENKAMHNVIVARAKIDDLEAVLRTVDEVSARHQVTLQLLDADAVYSVRHLESAILHAERAFSQGRNAAKGLGAEVLLYLSGERQVSRALERAGLKPGLERVVVLAIGHRRGAAIWDLLDRLHWSKDPAGLQENPRALDRYGIPNLNGSTELALLERVALVDVIK